MRSAETILGIIRERGRRGLPLGDVYRQLFNPTLFHLAYGRICANKGAMTPGVTAETADGMSQERILGLIEALRHERYRWKPARRIYIEKKHSMKKRPLGVPTWSDKLVQEAVRLILDAYYEPQFSSHSHGFRPYRGCHTALAEVQKMQGAAWFIEGDIAQCFDSLDHQVLVSILREKIHDNRFMRLIENMLKAGYLEEWRYYTTFSGTPQGGVASPILANIYLDRLDQYIEHTLLPAYNCGAKRHDNPTYRTMLGTAAYLRRTGRREEAKALKKQYQRLPSKVTNDASFRRLRYVRYSDDFLLGFTGPRTEAEAIKRQLGAFLRTDLKLELSEVKTLITHARSAAARFLGYEVTMNHCDQRYTQGRRTINAKVGLRVPADVIKAKCRLYLKGNIPMPRSALNNNSTYAIVTQYQQEYRGLVQYYQLAYNLNARLGRLKVLMEQSLVKTLAEKLRMKRSQVYKRYRSTMPSDHGPTRVLMVSVEREGKKPLVAQWGGIPLRWKKSAAISDEQRVLWTSGRNDLLRRLTADTCELCGSQVAVQVHHIRHLRDLARKGQKDPAPWVQRMAARQRKTLVACHGCHQAIHAGRPTGIPSDK